MSVANTDPEHVNLLSSSNHSTTCLGIKPNKPASGSKSLSAGITEWLHDSESYFENQFGMASIGPLAFFRTWFTILVSSLTSKRLLDGQSSSKCRLVSGEGVVDRHASQNSSWNSPFSRVIFSLDIRENIADVCRRRLGDGEVPLGSQFRGRFAGLETDRVRIGVIGAIGVRIRFLGGCAGSEVTEGAGCGGAGRFCRESSMTYLYFL